MHTGVRAPWNSAPPAWGHWRSLITQDPPHLRGSHTLFQAEDASRDACTTEEEEDGMFATLCRASWAFSALEQHFDADTGGKTCKDALVWDAAASPACNPWMPRLVPLQHWQVTLSSGHTFGACSGPCTAQSSRLWPPVAAPRHQHLPAATTESGLRLSPVEPPRSPPCTHTPAAWACSHLLLHSHCSSPLNLIIISAETCPETGEQKLAVCVVKERQRAHSAGGQEKDSLSLWSVCGELHSGHKPHLE